MKDWTGNNNSIYTTLGASNHTSSEREKNDYYATSPVAMELLLELETLSPNVWECACGQGHLSDVLIKKGYNVRSTDLIDRGYGEGSVDFLSWTTPWDGDIATNPPYKYASEFVAHALDLIPKGNKVVMFLKLTFAEGKQRKDFFKQHPPKTIYVSSSRIACAKNGDFEALTSGSAVAYAWWVWEKGYDGITEMRWFN